ncbi:hypothetical protein [Streptomyces sp. NPDC050560]|uniref:hypothetical protein n=1 Tax=Streptomyces sp. NPDC050560 TaxID=3365630 RepID=UPI0037B34118
MAENPTPENENETEAQPETAEEVQAHLAEAVLGMQKLKTDKGQPLGVAMSGGSCGAGSCL